MAWFKTDDQLHDVGKTRKALRGNPDARRDPATMGLWILAGSWCADQVATDTSNPDPGGWVPADELDRWADDPEPLAARLVAAGLWHVEEVEGQQGYRFHDWADYQPTRQKVAAGREAARERMANARRNNPRNSSDVRANTAGTSDNPVPVPVPVPKTEARKRATQLPDDFTPNDANRRIAEERGLDLTAVIAQWSDFHRAKGSTFKDWHAALNTWLRREQPAIPGARAQVTPLSQRVTVNHCGASDEGHARHRWDAGANHYLCPGA